MLHPFCCEVPIHKTKKNSVLILSFQSKLSAHSLRSVRPLDLFVPNEGRFARERRHACLLPLLLRAAFRWHTPHRFARLLIRMIAHSLCITPYVLCRNERLVEGSLFVVRATTMLCGPCVRKSLVVEHASIPHLADATGCSRRPPNQRGRLNPLL